MITATQAIVADKINRKMHQLGREKYGWTDEELAAADAFIAGFMRKDLPLIDIRCSLGGDEALGEVLEMLWRDSFTIMADTVKPLGKQIGPKIVDAWRETYAGPPLGER